MRELLVVNRIMETPLLSFGLDSTVQVSFRAVAHVLVWPLGNYFEYYRLLLHFGHWHLGMLKFLFRFLLVKC